MKKNIFQKSTFSLIIFLLFIGCMPKNLPKNNSIPFSTSTDLATLTATPIASPTLIVMPTLVEVTPVNTMTLEEQKMFVKTYRTDNGDCRLPCWWGITPGKTSWQDSETLLRHLGATIKQFQSETGGYNYGVLLRGLPELVFSFYDNGAPNSIVDKIFVSGNKGGGQDQREFEIFWESYSPKEVMTKYGIPSRILLDTLGTLGNTDMGKHGYTLWIFYDSLGFMIRYDGFIADEETFRFCFNLNQGANDIDHIELTLQHQDYAFPLEHDDSILGSASPRGLPLQDVTGISIEKIHQLFTQVGKPYCLETPHDIWPTK